MKFRPLVEVRVFFDRMGLILRAIPHLWRHYGDWDWAYPVATLTWRLERLERVIRADTVHEGVEEQANDIKRFLKLLDDYHHAIERVPKTPGVAHWLDHTLFKPAAETDDQQKERSEWAKAVYEFEQRSWDEAWDLFRQKAREWWV